MTGLLLILSCLGATGANAAWRQDPEARLAELLRNFENAPGADVALLAAQIDALGYAALEPATRRLAEDLSDGMASMAAPAILDVLISRRADLVPLRTALTAPGTPPAGRLQIARALTELGEGESWRPALREILADPGLLLVDRLDAAAILLEAGDEPALGLLEDLVGGIPSRPPAERRQILDFLSRVDLPEAQAMLEAALALPEPEAEPPLERLVDHPEPEPEVPPSPPEPKKSVVAAARWTTMVEIAAVAAALVLLLLCWLLQRKG